MRRFHVPRHWILLFAMLALGACQPGRQASAPAVTPTPTPPTAPASITGRVQLHGAPSSLGAQVFAAGTSLASFSDVQGNYAFTNVAPGDYQIYAHADGYERRHLGDVKVADTAATTSLYTLPLATLSPLPAPTPEAARRVGSVMGRIALDPAVSPPAGGVDWTRCVVELAGTDFRTACRSDGSFRLWDIPAAEYRLIANLPPFSPTAANVRVLPGETVTANLALAQARAATGNRRIFGYVELIDAQGQPVTDYATARVEVIDNPQLATPVGPDGRFEIGALPPDRYRVFAQAEGFAPSAPREINLAAVPEMEVRLTLSNAAAAGLPGAIIGRALKNLPEPAEQSGVRVALAGTSLIAVTDSTGLFSLPSVPAGAYQLIAEAEGFEPARLEGVQVPEGADLDVGTLTLEPIRDWPVVLEVNPADGAREVTIRREIPVTIRFSKKMNPASLAAALSIQPAVAFRLETGRDAPDTDFDLMRVVLLSGAGAAPPARYRTRYTLTLGTEASDFEGLNLQEPFRASFTTGQPAIIGSRPESGGTLANLAPSNPVVVLFNAPMDHSTFDERSLRIRPRLPMTPNIRVYEDAATGWSRINISASWQPDTDYEITIQSVRTAGNETLANTPYTLRFKTAKLRTYLPPGAQIRSRR